MPNFSITKNECFSVSIFLILFYWFWLLIFRGYNGRSGSLITNSPPQWSFGKPSWSILLSFYKTSYSLEFIWRWVYIFTRTSLFVSRSRATKNFPKAPDELNYLSSTYLRNKVKSRNGHLLLCDIDGHYCYFCLSFMSWFPINVSSVFCERVLIKFWS